MKEGRQVGGEHGVRGWMECWMDGRRQGDKGVREGVGDRRGGRTGGRETPMLSARHGLCTEACQWLLAFTLY